VDLHKHMSQIAVVTEPSGGPPTIRSGWKRSSRSSTSTMMEHGPLAGGSASLPTLELKPEQIEPLPLDDRRSRVRLFQFLKEPGEVLLLRQPSR
jgi:hypothetical protein